MTIACFCFEHVVVAMRAESSTMSSAVLLCLSTAQLFDCCCYKHLLASALSTLALAILEVH
jgi:hypothetical protein